MRRPQLICCRIPEQVTKQNVSILRRVQCLEVSILQFIENKILPSIPKTLRRLDLGIKIQRTHPPQLARARTNRQISILSLLCARQGGDANSERCREGVSKATTSRSILRGEIPCLLHMRACKMMDDFALEANPGNQRERRAAERFYFILFF